MQRLKIDFKLQALHPPKGAGSKNKINKNKMKAQIIYKIFLNKKIAIVTISLFEAVAGLQNLINIYGENNVTIYKQTKNKTLWKRNL